MSVISLILDSIHADFLTTTKTKKIITTVDHIWSYDYIHHVFDVPASSLPSLYQTNDDSKETGKGTFKRNGRRF